MVRKSDGVEIDENEIFIELKKSDKNLWLVALQADEEFSNFQKRNKFILFKVIILIK